MQVLKRGGVGGDGMMKGGGEGDSLLEEHGEHHLISLLGEACEEEDLVRCILA